ncbi:hypothetical protein CLV84_3411 [Neolewinella xylanilytica]|uniref:Outer membrane lipoprotein-sorting protein n=1 Tax=Neolewinella xylanilytica TaxID=1514080 RepID=A0A2S6I5Q7_9BACT|nr:hypothetical protein [Neolewinella xylanilytica]PPK86482.1 hypothetical protein CLV84_3411 [Neolewinella xylanilytica]
MARMKFSIPLLLLGLLGISSCDSTDSTTESSASDSSEINPAAEGFDLAGSDPQAIAIADSVVKYHGGRKAYDDVRFLQWNFFGARRLTWDKEEDRVRIDVPNDSMIYLLDFSDDDLTGAVSKNGMEMTEPDSIDLYLQDAYSMWINDSYWLVQPFKLKDSGVTLKYAGEGEDPQKNRPSDILELTFTEVGDTPGNKYRLYVDKENYRINTWQFFRTADDAEPAISTPFDGYQDYAGVMLSGDRGGRFQLQDISVTNDMDESVFTEF